MQKWTNIVCSDHEHTRHQTTDNDRVLVEIIIIIMLRKFNILFGPVKVHKRTGWQNEQMKFILYVY